MEKNFVFIIDGKIFEGANFIEDTRIPVAVKAESYEAGRTMALEIAQTISRGYNESILTFFFRVCNK